MPTPSPSSPQPPELHPSVHPRVREITERVRERSADSRAAYLDKIGAAAGQGPNRQRLACSNLAHGFAGCVFEDDREALRGELRPNIAIVSAYNDMLSAHQPLETYPALLKQAVREAGGVAQFAGGVPAMCDGITQGEAGMELSLFSRDVIAMATAIALSHDMFDGALCLGVCDKIVPGLLIGALSFGHLPFVFLPAGPMTSGLPNADKSRIRQLFAEGKVERETLLEAESQAYHSPGTCTFYGTANSNQMLMEILGLHLPGASFANPGTPLRDALTREAGRRVVALTALAGNARPLGEMIDERALVNAIVGLLATGGSTNHTIHLVAIGRAAGVRVDWQDFEDLSSVVPLLARVYPNGTADVNHFRDAGGMAFLIGQLLDAGLLHPDVATIADDQPGVRRGLEPYRREVLLADDSADNRGGNSGGRLAYRDLAASRDEHVLRPATRPFQAHGGLRLLRGNLGRCVVKLSAVRPEQRRVEAPAVVFDHQEQLAVAFTRGELDRDLVAVVRFQGPQANGMPELHKLMPPLGVLQDRGFRVALVTDGRLSGASGKVPAAIHLVPEALGGPLAKVRDGDVILLDPDAGVLEANVDAETWQAREPARPDLTRYQSGVGRELFAGLRSLVGSAEDGAPTFGPDSLSDPVLAATDAATVGDDTDDTSSQRPRGRDQPRVTVLALED